MKEILFDQVASPVGAILIAVADNALCGLDFEPIEDRLEPMLRRRFGTFKLVRTRDPLGVSTRIRAYLKGDMRAFDGIVLDGGGTPFQRRVWAALLEIPPGMTTSYGKLAAYLGMPKASRAVGLANGSNPISIVVPCHRVIGASGALTGYGGGIERKRWLLEHETAALAASCRRSIGNSRARSG